MVSVESLLRQPFKASKDAFEVSADHPGKDQGEPPHWQFERDSAGRLWYDIPGTKVHRAALVEQSANRAMLTKGGRHFLQQLTHEKRRQLLGQGISQSLGGEFLQVSGTEGPIRKVDDLPPGPGWIQILLGAIRNTNVATDRSLAEVTAIEKTFQLKGALHGWEMAYLLDQLHNDGLQLDPTIQQLCGITDFRVIQPIAGMHRTLYTPFLEGSTLEDFFDPLYELYPTLAKKVVQPIHDYTSKVRRAIFYDLQLILGELGYASHENEMYKYIFIDGYTHFLRKNSDHTSTVLDVFIDVHPMENHPYDRYRNWMLSPEVSHACWEIAQDSRPDSDKVEQIAALITDTAIMFDPLYVRQRHRRR